MFDSVIFTCPKCGGRVEAQSKVGDCLLTEYEPQAVPLKLAMAIQGDWFSCEGCGERWQVEQLPQDGAAAAFEVKRVKEAD